MSVSRPEHSSSNRPKLQPLSTSKAPSRGTITVTVHTTLPTYKDNHPVHRRLSALSPRFRKIFPSSPFWGSVCALCQQCCRRWGRHRPVSESQHKHPRSKRPKYLSPSPQAKRRGEGGSVRSTETGEEPTRNDFGLLAIKQTAQRQLSERARAVRCRGPGLPKSSWLTQILGKSRGSHRAAKIRLQLS